MVTVTLSISTKSVGYNTINSPKAKIIKIARSGDDKPPSSKKKVKKLLNNDGRHITVINQTNSNENISLNLEQKVEGKNFLLSFPF